MPRGFHWNGPESGIGRVRARSAQFWRAVACAAVLAGALAPARAAEGYYGSFNLRGSEASLMKTASEYEDLFARRGYMYRSAEVEELIARVGVELAPPPTDDYIRYRFHIARDPDANAFALPNGQIYINTGLLAVLENEAQVAAILAHEVYHTAGHHTILEYRSIRAKNVENLVLGPLTFGISNIFLILSVYGYSRDLESESDRKGLAQMLEKGYDPREMARVFEILAEDPEEETPKRATAWSTHPQLMQRVETSRTLCARLLGAAPDRPLRTGREGYRGLVFRLSLDTVQDLIAADYPRSAHVLASRLLSERPDDPVRLLALADAWRALGARELKPQGEGPATNQEKKKNVRQRAKATRAEREAERLATPEGRAALKINLEAARRSYFKALEGDPDLAEAHRGLGLTLLGLDDPEGAGRELVIYLRARPDATDRPIITERLKDLTEKIRSKGDADTPDP